MSLAFSFHGLAFEARASGALWWPEARWLIVADLHLGKSERMARRGGALLPPYECLATLEKLGTEIAALDPATIISLGDGFDDLTAARELDPDILARLHRLAAGRQWIWVAGNHDPGSPTADLPGLAMEEAKAGPVTLRHEARPEKSPDISGHFHPVVRLAGTRHRAFLIGQDHLIMPAFGTYTGGLHHDAPQLAGLIPTGIAGACCGQRVLPIPIRAQPKH